MKLTKQDKKIVNLALFRLQSDVLFQTRLEEISGANVFNHGRELSLNDMIETINKLQGLFK